MIVWGGENYFIGDLNTGGVYVPVTDSWTATTTSNAPNRRQDDTAISTEREMIIWGGLDAQRQRVEHRTQILRAATDAEAKRATYSAYSPDTHPASTLAAPYSMAAAQPLD